MPVRIMLKKSGICIVRISQILMGIENNKKIKAAVMFGYDDSMSRIILLST